MDNLKFKIISQILFGIVLAMFFSVIGLIIGMQIGGNYGCLPMIDWLFGTRGYESCGAFGGVLGMVGGATIGAYLFGILPIKNYRHVLWFLIILIILPIIFYSVSVLTSSNYSGSAGAFFWGLLKIFSIPTLTASLVTWIFNIKTLQ
ncbi:MAG TPA: hypothetical protein PLB38_01525 [bacterium]|nr:hypothetical protein [bacterium]